MSEPREMAEPHAEPGPVPLERLGPQPARLPARAVGLRHARPTRGLLHPTWGSRKSEVGRPTRVGLDSAGENTGMRKDVPGEVGDSRPVRQP